MKSLVACVVASIVCRLLALCAVLAFVYLMIVFTGNPVCLWLLLLIFAVDFIPVYAIVPKNLNDEGDHLND